MEYDRQLLMTMYSEEELKKFLEECRLWIEEINRAKVEGVEAMNRKREEMMLEEMNIIAKEKMLRRRRERLIRHVFRRRQTTVKKKIPKSQDSESFTSDDSDQEMKEEVKRLMEKAIQETLIEEESKAEEMKKIEEDFKDDMIENSKDEKIFPRRRGRLIRYVRRHSSKSHEEDFHIEFHHLQLPSDDEDDSDEEMNN